MIGNAQLEITLINGTSARSYSQFAVQHNVIGYAASGGVVVCHLKDGAAQNQRFYCANNFTQPETLLGLDTYLPSDGLEVQRDSYGYALNCDAFTWGAAPSPSHVAIPSSPSRSPINSKYTGNDDFPAKLKLKSIHCIAISPDRKLLAVGESGHQPRILLFSLAPDASGTPIAIINEHQFGVSALTFSPDSSSLCSLGFTNDGFLHVWKLHRSPAALTATLTQSNKCSTIINKLLWINGNIITLGLRFIKLWYFAENLASPTKNTAIKGRNVLLDEFMNSNFVDAEIVNAEEILFVTDQGEFALLPVQDEQLRLVKMKRLLDQAQSVLVDHEKNLLWVATDRVECVSLESLVPDSDLKIKKTLHSVHALPHRAKPLEGILLMDEVSPNVLVYLDSNERISSFNKETKVVQVLVNSLLKNLGGVKECTSGAPLVFSKTAEIRKLVNNNSSLEPLMNFQLPSNALIENALTCLDAFKDLLVLGDKYGSLYVLSNANEVNTHKLVFNARAHESTVNDLVVFEFKQLQVIASTSRDKMIQVFTRDSSLPDSEWSLLNTLSVHRSTASQVIHHEGRIIVSSLDRSISIHKLEALEGEGNAEKVRIVQEKIIILKNSPVAIKVFRNELIVSTNDKVLSVFDLSNFELIRNLKLFNDYNQSLLVEHLLIQNDQIFVSCNDKSLRSFLYSTGKPIATNWAHSDVIIGLMMIDASLLTISNDGCVFNWEYKNRESNATFKEAMSRDDPEDWLNSPLKQKVTRKILSATPVALAARVGRTVPITTPSRKLAPASPSPRRNLSSPRVYTPVSSPPKSPLRPAVTRPLAPSMSPTPRNRSPSPVSSAVRVTAANIMSSPRLKSESTPRLANPLTARLSLFGGANQKLNGSGYLPVVEAAIASRGIAITEEAKPNAECSDITTVLTMLGALQNAVKNKEYAAEDLAQIKSALMATLGVMNEGILEDYSDKLLAMFERKLGERNERNVTLTPNDRKLDLQLTEGFAGLAVGD
ncbi:hypothetical protein BABINDRAFT_159814 [Babjeviella inositovora NRRL Y-12698]|uniref:Uncharacterized protein n=1 Tax=Babjeviella inositovora NRRL Y-12698 TaxID=984486 RepID=A0A1E3QV52_9ASCO|nr:uncharacterized protein BABINDRAFT_159814 [Babjeviella inositovora NRRL Y-12698]ODQ81538.1 hypothetical protein BABINDRAFT_159814 [Babjeviella inositovora NRRL Y-12698]